jgi:hypothetical protein
MARGLVFTLDGETSSFGLTKVDREKLYGRKERVVVDENGVACAIAHLLSDGDTVVPPGGTTALYVDSHFQAVERSALKAVDATGNPLPIVPSTLGVPVPLKHVDARRVLDHMVGGVYQLEPEELGANLRAALEAGQLFEGRYNYREGYDDSAAFLLKNDQGIFALIADRLDFEFLQRDAPPPEPAADAEALEEELDFSMM